MKALLLSALIMMHGLVQAGKVQLHVTATGHANEHVLLYAYGDLFTLRAMPLMNARADKDGHVLLEANLDHVTKAMIRVGDVTADLWLREGVYHVEFPKTDLKTVRSMNGTTRVDLLFKELDHMDINALIADLNTRLDDFIAQDLATDQATGMQAIDIARKDNEPLHADTVKRPNTLFITPSWSTNRLDSFELKLRHFYADVKDPWFWNNLDYGVAGLRFGPRANDRELFEKYLKGKPVLYDVPEYVRFVSSFFEDHLMRSVFRSHEAALFRHVKNSDADSLKQLFAKSDFLKDDDRLCELIVLRELYANYHNKLLDRSGVMGALMKLFRGSKYAEHRTLAANMIWDLTTMRVGAELPSITVQSLEGGPVQLEQDLLGATLIAVTAGWCTYCEQEIVALERLHKEYGEHVKILAISMDASPEELKAYLRKHPERDWTWLYGGDDPLLLDQLRVRSLPAFFLLNDRMLARAPAPPPSNGLAALFFQMKAKWDEEHKLKPDGGQPPPRRR